MRALRSDGGRVFLDDRSPQPDAAGGEALIRPARLGVSLADYRIASGQVRFRGVLGHQFVGTVERLWDGAEPGDKSELVGRRVVGVPDVVCGRCDLCRRGLSAHCRQRATMGVVGRDGCFAELFALPVRNLHRVPEGVGDDEAVFAVTLAAALHAAQQVRVEGKPYVTVLGDNVMGLLCAQVLARLNASVRLLGAHPEKFGLCEKWGVKHRHEDDAGRRRDQDVVVDCTGTARGLAEATALVRPRGTVVLTYPMCGPSGPDLGALVDGEIAVLGSRGGSLRDALDLLARREIDVVSLISRRARLEDGVPVLEAGMDPGQIRVLLEP